MAESDTRLETLEDEVKVLKGEVKRTLVDLRALLMRESSPLGEGAAGRRAAMTDRDPNSEAITRKEVTETNTSVIVRPPAEVEATAIPGLLPEAAAPASRFPRPDGNGNGGDVLGEPGPGPGLAPGDFPGAPPQASPGLSLGSNAVSLETAAPPPGPAPAPVSNPGSAPVDSHPRQGLERPQGQGRHRPSNGRHRQAEQPAGQDAPDGLTEEESQENESGSPNRNGRAGAIYDEYQELLEETREVYPIIEDSPAGPPLDVNLLSNLVYWVARAKRQVGEQQLKDILELYIQSGHSRPELKDLLLRISNLVDGAALRVSDSATEWVDLVFHLHGILTGGFPVVKIPQIRLPAPEDAESDRDN